MNGLPSVLGRYVSHLKGEEYRIDPAVSDAYLVRTVVDRVMMVLRGYVRFPLRAPRPFLGPGVVLRGTRRLTFGSGVTFAEHSFVDAMSVKGVRLGANTSVGKHTRVECTGSLRHLGAGLIAGNHVGLGTDCLYGCAGGIEIGDDTIIGNYVTLHSENHNVGDLNKPIRLQGVNHQGIRIGRDCWIGSKSTILDGVVIGNGCIIAAGSVVTAGNYEDYCVYAGVPAKLIRRRCGV